ncbi:hypothetical protein [Aquimarina sp. AU474]|uniref:hypothetical protein n=1 Tax=Aquimarina sp. AU474 TaxID=2108529 RepID=UPI0013595167|nr:hypothetical protein [Aquimarina sp. AU474]
MKKVILILIAVVMTSFTSVPDLTIIETVATYNGQSDKAIYFTDAKNGKVLEFSILTKKVLSKYDLTAKEYIGAHFTITYEEDKIEIVGDRKEVSQVKKRLILMDIDKKENIIVKN